MPFDLRGARFVGFGPSARRHCACCSRPLRARLDACEECSTSIRVEEDGRIGCAHHPPDEAEEEEGP